MATSVRLIRRYVWLVETVRRAGQITFEEINRKWLDDRSLRLEHEKAIPERTFHRHRQAIADLFGIDILCNRYNGNTYYIDNMEALSCPSFTSRLFSGLAIDNQLAANKEIASRISFEEMASGGSEYLSPIIEAMIGSRKLLLGYRKFGQSEIKERVVAPYGLKQSAGRWYLAAKNEGYDDISVYALDRFESLDITGETFEFDRGFNIDEYFGEVVGTNVDMELDCEKVKLRVYDTQRPYIESLPIHKSQRLLEHTREYSDYELTLRPEREFQRAVLALGPEAEVISPRWLRDEIKWLAEETAGRYIDSGVEAPEYLFLDFDGVLNSGIYRNRLAVEGKRTNDKFGPLFDPSAVNALSALIEKYPGMKIVVTSSWRYMRSFDELREMWKSREMPGKLHSVLPRDTFCETRGEEVAEYLREHGKSSSYIIIDDENDFTEEQQSRCIITDPATGLRLSDLKSINVY